uniref:Ubiquitin conjugation factor E4 core domain-containing protein n=2 Tax=Rhodosorus marinus TaxID=101924 RepID=A0A7S3AAF0_9RHOD|mmetsp:Transcript_8040/g.35759  ORF Transcript_8040/g.35759 Transcript_8040/m.35759 type:complete len:767 (+) Transcript_8040:227-2527(+)
MNWLRGNSGDGEAEGAKEDVRQPSAPSGSNPISREEMIRRRNMRFANIGKAVQKEGNSTEAQQKDQPVAKKPAVEKNETPTAKEENVVATPKVVPKATRPPMSTEQLISASLSKILMSSLGKPVPKTTFLEDLTMDIKQELELGDEDPIYLSEANADRIIFERITKFPEVIEFLVDSFSRGVEELRRTKNEDIRRTAESTMNILALWVGRILASPEDFVSYPTSAARMAEWFALRLASRGVPFSLLESLVSNFEGQDETVSLSQILEPIFAYFADSNLKSNLMSPRLIPNLKGLSTLLSNKTIAQKFTESPRFLPKDRFKAGKDVKESLLGRILGVSLLDDTGLQAEFFPDPLNTSAAEVQSNIFSLRETLKAYWENVAKIFMCLFESGVTGRSAALDWVAVVSKLNGDRKKTYFNRDEVVGDGFILNLVVVMLKVCAPFAVPSSPKLEKIDPTYVLSDVRVDYSEETRLGVAAGSLERIEPGNSSSPRAAYRHVINLEPTDLVDENQVPLPRNPNGEDVVEVSSKFGFITETFYLTGSLLEIGYSSTYSLYGNTLMRINELRSQVDRVQSMGAGMGPLGGFREVMLKKLEKETLEEARRKLCYDVYLIENDQDDPDLISFAAASSSYLLRLLCFGKPPELPLSVPPSMKAAVQVEAMVDDIVNIMINSLRYDPEAVDRSVALIDNILTLSVVAINSPLHFKNPYLRSRLAELLWLMAPRTNGRYGKIWEGLEFVTADRMPCSVIVVGTGCEGTQHTKLLSNLILF